MTPAKYVLTRHDDGAWYRATLLDQWRTAEGRWRCSIMYYVGVGEQYSRAVWADELRRATDP